MRKVLSAISLLMVLCLGICGCSETTEDPAVTTGTPETDPETTEAPVTEAPVEQTLKAAALEKHLLTTGRAGVIGDALALDWTWAKAEFEGYFLAGDITARLSLDYGKLGDLLVVVDDDYDNAVKITLTSKRKTTKTLVTLEEGYHNIKLYKANQARSGGINLYELTCTAALAPAPEAAKLKIQVIGDSITCGAGAVPNDRDEGQSDMAEYSYAALLSKQLDADVSVMSVSGWGIACGGQNYDNLIPNIFDKTNHFRDADAEWDFTNDQPDVVIVALGTNDYRFYNENRTDVLIDASKSFLQEIREVYPNARILWVYGQMLNQYNNQLKQMVRGMNDSKMEYMNLPRNVDGGYGHPNAAGHEEYAELIKEWIVNRFPEMAETT